MPDSYVQLRWGAVTLTVVSPSPFTPEQFAALGPITIALAEYAKSFSTEGE